MLVSKSMLTIMAGVGAGTALEWYDFALYSGLFSTITANFFPKGNADAAAIAFWGVYAVGFIARPVGALLFGHVGDTAGRRTSLLWSMAAIAIPTVLIGCLPTYGMIGDWAPAMLAVLRAMQGLALGGEYGTAQTYIGEIASKGREGVAAAFVVSAAGLGILLGNVAVLIVLAACSPEQLLVWGWRLPFLATVVNGSLALLLRLNMPESAEFEAARKALECGVDPKDITPAGFDAADAWVVMQQASDGKAGAALTAPRRRRCLTLPVVVLVMHNWLPVMLQVLLDAFAAVTVASYVAYLPAYFRSMGIPPVTVQGMLISCMVFNFITAPLSGHLADRGMPLLWGIAVVAALGTGLAFVSQTVFALNILAASWVMQLVMASLIGLVMPLMAVSSTRLYPAIARTSGYNFAYNLSVGTLGGLTPLAITALQQSLNASGHSTIYGPAWWMLAGGAATMCACVAIHWHSPHCNYTHTNWERRQVAAARAAEAGEATRVAVVV